MSSARRRKFRKSLSRQDRYFAKTAGFLREAGRFFLDYLICCQASLAVRLDSSTGADDDRPERFAVELLRNRSAIVDVTNRRAEVNSGDFKISPVNL
jgi:hypothetical protein